MAMASASGPSSAELSTCGKCNAAASADTPLYELQCTHMRVCLKCGTSLCQAKAPCGTCQKPITKLVKEYTLRAHPSRKHYPVGRFYDGWPGFKPRVKGTQDSWQMVAEEGDGAVNGVVSAYTLSHRDGSEKRGFRGAREGGQHANYLLFVPHGSEFLAMPAGDWFNFKPEIRHATLSLEEAEDKMAKLRSAVAGSERWMMRGKEAKSTAAEGGGSDGEASDGEDGSGSDDEERAARALGEEGRKKKKRGGGEEGEDAGEEEEEAAGEEEGGKGKKTSKVKTEADGDESDKGDDWEHDGDFTDDDEAVGVGDQDNDNDPDIMNAVAKHKVHKGIIKDEEEEGDDEEDLTSAGKELQKLLGRAVVNQGDDDDDEDEEDEEGDDDDMEGLDPDTDIIPSFGHASLVIEEPASAQAPAALGAPAVEEKPIVAPSAGKRELPSPEPAAPSAKRIRSNGGEGVPVERPPTEGEAEPEVKPQAASEGPITAQELAAYLKGNKETTVKDLLQHFKKRIKKQGQNEFRTIMAQVATIKPIGDKKIVQLK
ncbi:hypothetical protein CYMTET_31188 [Cymbomonas tetramitiformis]|uniref:Transcription initiation factor IIF subunit alpha n=1 Tax=Cymbomonas tetramitiformis TaxID=36881 RepID=A0AAE0KTF9_9CHLO|nr:hypothetical protein CYMTET_31188 [Cymbomonas tetramitiformis]